MSQTFTIVPFRSELASDEDLTRLMDLQNLVNRESDPDHIPAPREQRMKGIRDPNPNITRHEWIIQNTFAFLATAVLFYYNESHPAYEQNKNSCMSGITVHPDYRRQGLGTQLLKTMLSTVKDTGRPVLLTQTEHNAGHEFATKLGGKVGLEGAENRLYLNEVDWDMINRWAEEGPNRAPGVELQQFLAVPEDIIEEFCQLYTETMNQQPLGEIELVHQETPASRREDEKRMNHRELIWTTLVSREADGTISGLTELIYNPHTPHKAMQNLTGVKQKYRGRGLGKWLKAEMLLRFREDHPHVKYITTGNADSNAPMLSINNRMGYRRFKSNKLYKFDVADLLSQLLS